MQLPEETKQELLWDLQTVSECSKRLKVMVENSESGSPLIASANCSGMKRAVDRIISVFGEEKI